MNTPDDHDLIFETVGYCAVCRRYTRHECTVCAQKQAIPGDLALVAEVQALRAANAALVHREAAVIKVLESIRIKCTLDDQERQAELYYLCDYARAMTDEALKALKAGAS